MKGVMYVYSVCLLVCLSATKNFPSNLCISKKGSRNVKLYGDLVYVIFEIKKYPLKHLMNILQ